MSEVCEGPALPVDGPNRRVTLASADKVVSVPPEQPHADPGDLLFHFRDPTAHFGRRESALGSGKLGRRRLEVLQVVNVVKRANTLRSAHTPDTPRSRSFGKRASTPSVDFTEISSSLNLRMAL